MLVKYSHSKFSSPTLSLRVWVNGSGMDRNVLYISFGTLDKTRTYMFPITLSTDSHSEGIQVYCLLSGLLNDAK